MFLKKVFTKIKINKCVAKNATFLSFFEKKFLIVKRSF
jgi:hypothetical protein